jgi:predicted kinase
MSSQPILVVITGAPGSGKSTLADKLKKQLGWRLIRRDDVKLDLLVDLGQSHEEAGPNINQVASERFFSLVGDRLNENTNVIAEAAFQHKIWATWLCRISGISKVRLLICEVKKELAIKRFNRRRVSDPGRIQFQGDHLAAAHQLIHDYQKPNIELPTLTIDTTHDYQPGITEIVDFCRR